MTLTSNNQLKSALAAPKFPVNTMRSSRPTTRGPSSVAEVSRSISNFEGLSFPDSVSRVQFPHLVSPHQLHCQNNLRELTRGYTDAVNVKMPDPVSVWLSLPKRIYQILSDSQVSPILTAAPGLRVYPSTYLTWPKIHKA